MKAQRKWNAIDRRNVGGTNSGSLTCEKLVKKYVSTARRHIFYIFLVKLIAQKGDCEIKIKFSSFHSRTTHKYIRHLESGLGRIEHSKKKTNKSFRRVGNTVHDSTIDSSQKEGWNKDISIFVMFTLKYLALIWQMLK